MCLPLPDDRAATLIDIDLERLGKVLKHHMRCHKAVGTIR